MTIEFKQTTLDNGLTILAEINNAAHTAAAGFFVKTGTRDEPIDIMGASHFLEHMMFKGTNRRTAEQVNIDFDKIGASYNASTSQETTTYYAHVLPEFLSDAIDILADILRPSLREDDFEMEKKVILEEISMYADQPFWVAYEQAMENHFTPHPLGYRILGSNDSITNLTCDQMRSYFQHRYSPDNIVISLAGRLDFDRCIEQLQLICGKWSTTGASRDYTSPTSGNSTKTINKDKINRHYEVAICPAPSHQDDQRYAAYVLANILGDSDGSRLYWKLIDPGLADEVSLSFNPFDHTGTFLAYISCDPSRSNDVHHLFMDVLDNALQNLSPDEVERSRNKIAMGLMLRNELPAGRMMGLGTQWLYNNEYFPIEEELRRLYLINVDSIKAMGENWSFQPRTVVRLSPKS